MEPLNNQNDMIQGFDNDGNPISINKQDWINGVFLHNVKLLWDKPDDLYGIILVSFNNNIFLETLEASKHLLHIDYNKERGTTTLGICYLKLNMIEDAKLLFENYINEYGDSAIILVNLAKVFAELNSNSKAEELLYKALTIDPNVENGLDWWGAIHFEKGGDNAFIESMRQIAEIKGSWRPQLWLFKNELKNNSKDKAIGYIPSILETSSNNPDALYIISGELGQSGNYNEIYKYIVPIYRPEIHGPKPAINLLQLYLETNNIESGFSFLNKIKSLYEYIYPDHWNYYEVEFNKLKPSN